MSFHSSDSDTHVYKCSPVQPGVWALANSHWECPSLKTAANSLEQDTACQGYQVEVGVPQLGVGVAAAESFTRGLPRNNNVIRGNSKKVTTAIIQLGTPSDDPTDLPSPPEVCSRPASKLGTHYSSSYGDTSLSKRASQLCHPSGFLETPTQHVLLLQWLPRHSIPGDTGTLRPCMQTRLLPWAGDPGLWSHPLHPFRAHKDPSLPATPIRPGTKGTS